MNVLNKEKNYAMLLDFYELTMINGYLKSGYASQIAVFDLFFRKVPDNGGFVIACGLNEVVDYILNIKFDHDDINFLKSQNIFDQDFFDFLLNFKFTGDLYSVKEGSVVYPNEPIVVIKAPILEAQLIETMLLLIINHQSLIATKTSRIVRAARGKDVIELGARRAHGFDAAIYGAKAAYIAGVKATATVLAGKLYNIPITGTMAHSWIQFFNDEYEAFAAYAKVYPDSCTLLVDTYNTLKSGVINAIRVHKDILEPMGKSLKAIRIDSGDLAYLSKKARELLDNAGLYDTKIVVSNSVDEQLIFSLINQDAKIDVYGVGERLITAKSDPVFGGVYKLVSIEDQNKNYLPRIKVSNNVEKVVNPGFKKLYRGYDSNGTSIYDIIALHDEVIDTNTVIKNLKKPYKNYPILEDVTVECLHLPIIINGELVYDLPTLEEIKEHLQNSLTKVSIEETRFNFPHEHYVDLTSTLYDLRVELLNKYEK